MGGGGRCSYRTCGREAMVAVLVALRSRCLWTVLCSRSRYSSSPSRSTAGGSPLSRCRPVGGSSWRRRRSDRIPERCRSFAMPVSSREQQQPANSPQTLQPPPNTSSNPWITLYHADWVTGASQGQSAVSSRHVLVTAFAPSGASTPSCLAPPPDSCCFTELVEESARGQDTRDRIYEHIESFLGVITTVGCLRKEEMGALLIGKQKTAVYHANTTVQPD